jgi:IPT/TIG domain
MAENKTLPPGSPTGSPFESINEPPGSQVIPPGAGAGTGEEVVHPPGSIPEGPTGPAEDEAPVIEALEPDEAEVGSADVVLEVTGTRFVQGSVIQFGPDNDLPTTYISDTELTAPIKPSEWGDGVVEVRVKNADGGLKSEPVEFEFIEQEAPASRQTKRTQPKKTKKKR